MLFCLCKADLSQQPSEKLRKGDIPGGSPWVAHQAQRCDEKDANPSFCSELSGL